MNAADAKKIRLIMNLRTAGINDARVLNAIERVPREMFIPDTFRDQAWEDTALPIGLGQTISQPLVVGAMTQGLELTDRDKVLEIGTGCGYQAAILSRLARRVYTIERHRPLAELSHRHFEQLRISNITAICGDGMKGWPEAGQAPFDKIIVTAAARDKPPQALLDQLRIGGIMIVPVGQNGNGQSLRRYRKESDDTYSMKDLMPVRFVPLLPDVAKAADYSKDDLDKISA